MKAVILNYTGGRANWGSQATSAMLAAFLAENLADTGITEIDTVPLPPPHLSDRGIRKRHGKWLAELYGQTRPSATALDQLDELARRRFAHHFTRMLESDVVFFQGEGTISDAEFFSDLRLFALPMLAVHRYGKKLITLNQSISLAHPGSADIVRAQFAAAAINAFREIGSIETAGQLGLPHVTYCPDMAFLLSRHIPPPATLSTPRTFCVTGSAILDDDYIARLVDVVASISDETGLRPVFLAATGRDAEPCHKYRSLRQDGADLVSQSNAQTFMDIVPLLQQAAFTIGGRYHTSIKSVALGTPVVLLESNSKKSDGLSRMLFADNRVRKPEEKADILGDVGRILADPQAERQQLAKATAGFAREFSAFAGRIRTELPTSAKPAKIIRTRTARTPSNGRPRKILGYSWPTVSLSENLRCYDSQWQPV